MPPLDPEMVTPIHDRLTANGVQLRLGDGVTGFEQTSEGTLIVSTKSGEKHPADLVILGIGVRPETKIAKDAGLDIGDRGGIRVNEQMRTNDEHIWAVGDAVEVRDWVTGEWILIPLAGPANRQGRVAADAICGRDTTFRGVQGTTVCGVFGLIIATTGATVFDLEEAELCYAPQFGAAKDPVNLAGMVAANVLRGDAPIIHWDKLAEEEALLLDVREIGEFEAGHVEGALNIPLTQLRDRVHELPKDQKIAVYCQVGQRAYYATRALRLQGFDAHNLTGGFKTYKAVQ